MPTAKRKQALAPAEVVIPEKIYFRIGEVSTLAKLPTYVLRFWETEFSQLRPTKSSTGQRMYRRKDVEFVMQIRKLLYEDGFTIAGAREQLRELSRAARLPEPALTPVQAQKETAPAPVSEGKPEQPMLFPVVVDPDAGKRRKKLQSVQQQLREVINLLS